MSLKIETLNQKLKLIKEDIKTTAMNNLNQIP